MNPNHVNYVASEGKFNIWYHENDCWQLLSDSNGAPLEFDSRESAEENQGSLSYKKTSVRRAPTQIHPTDYLNWSAEKIEEFLTQNSITEPDERKIFSEILAASTPVEQSQIWVAALERYPKYYLGKYSSNKNTDNIIRSIYVNDSYFTKLIMQIIFQYSKYE